jgi:hypothetical protein|tara:strand:- start:314 stop:475 length:162 start_codon:yes stop_codon:yes gene_type:complete
MISVNFTQNPRYLFFKPPLKEYGQINNKNDVNPVTAGSQELQEINELFLNPPN